MSLAGLLLRLFRLGHQSFWNDEILTVDNAGGTLLETLVGLRDPNILPLYYLVVHGLIGAEPAEIWLRLPSVVFGTLSIPLFYAVVRHQGGPRLALVAAALLACSPLHVWYSQEARPYALLILLSLLALRAVQLALERPTIGRQTAAVLMAAAVFYCHTIGIGFLAFLGVYVLLETPSREWRRWLPAGLGLLAVLAPGVARLALFPPVGSADVFKPVSLWSLGYAAWVFATGYSLGPSPTDVHQYVPWQVVTPHLTVIVVVAACVALALLSGAVGLRARHPALFRTVLAWVAFPIGLALAGAMATVHPFNVRYALLASPAFLLLLAAGLEGPGRGRRRWLAAAAAASIGVWSLGNYYFVEHYARDDNRSAGRYLSRVAHPDDLVIATAGYTAQNLRYYAGTSLHVVAYPGADGGPAVVRGASLAPAVIGARYVDPRSVASHLGALADGHDRIWLFLSRTFHSDPHGLIAAWLDDRLCRAVELRWPGVELRLYTRPTPGGPARCPPGGAAPTK